MEAVGDGTASQVLVEFLEGISGITFEVLLAAVKRHVVMPEVAAIWRCATYALRQQRGRIGKTVREPHLPRQCGLRVDGELWGGVRNVTW